MRVEHEAGRATRGKLRDHRVDLLRGFALAVIFINHMPGHWMGQWTPRNFGFSDAAELFVLLAGFAAAMAYAGPLERADYLAISAKAVRRAGVLYTAHIATTLAACALFWWATATFAEPGDLDLIGVAPLVSNPSASVPALLVGGFQLSYFNILPLYVVLLLSLPLMLWLAARDLRLLALASGATWLAAGISGVNLPRAADLDSWFFNPLAWQALFALGLAIGIRVSRGESVVPYHPAIYAGAAGYLAFAAWWRTAGPGGDLAEDVLPYWIGSLQKPNLPLARLAHVASLAYVVCHSRAWSWLARVPREFVLVRMGRNSLPVFMLGSLLSMTGWLIMMETHENMMIETALAIAGIALMAVLATVVERTGSLPRLGTMSPRMVPARVRQRRPARMTR